MKSLRCCSLLEYTFSIFLAILLVGCKKGEMPESERKESIEAVLSSAGELPREAIRAFKSKETTKDVLRSGKPIVEYKDKSSPDSRCHRVGYIPLGATHPIPLWL